MDLDARQEAAERRRDQIPQAQRGDADEDDAALQRPGRDTALQHVDGREAREGARGPAEAHEQAPVGLERERPLVEPERRAPSRRIDHRQLASRQRGSDRREREARIEVSPELDDLGHAPEDPVRIGRRVQKAGRPRGLGQGHEAADDPRGAGDSRRAIGRGRARAARQADAREVAGPVHGRAEGEGEADHRRALPERIGEGGVPDGERDRLAGQGASPTVSGPSRQAPRRSRRARWRPRPSPGGDRRGGQRGRGTTASGRSRSGSARRSRRAPSDRTGDAAAPRSRGGRRRRARSGPGAPDGRRGARRRRPRARNTRRRAGGATAHDRLRPPRWSSAAIVPHRGR